MEYRAYHGYYSPAVQQPPCFAQGHHAAAHNKALPVLDINANWIIFFHFKT
jgi:hypothetical protein